MKQYQPTDSGGTVTFKYDPLGRRIYKSSSSAATIFLYDGYNLIQTVNGSGSTVARYTQSQRTDEPMAVQQGTTSSYYESDGIASITSLSASTGTITQTYTYDSFGNNTNSSGSLTNSIRYTAREFDAETGLYYYRARYYDPFVGRFLSEDGERFHEGVDFYLYVHNRPNILQDPSGLAAVGVGLTGTANIGAFWTGVGVEGGFYGVRDSQGNWGILDCRAGGIGAVNGVGASVQATTLICPNCQSICDMEGTSGGIEGFGGVGLTGAAGGGATLSGTSATISAGGGIGVGAGGGVVGVVGDCTLIYKQRNCPTCSKSK